MDEIPPTLQVRLFQSFEVFRENHLITRFEADSARALLAYLAVQPGKAVARESLAQLLWDDEDGANPLTNLRSALRRVRTAIDATSDGKPPVDYLLADRSTLMFNPAAPAWVDVLEFEKRLDLVRRHHHSSIEECAACIDHLRHAVDLYRGAFLVDISLDSPGFEEWRRIERERLQRMALSALYTLGERAYRTGDFAGAEQLARRQLTLEPWNEEAHRQLMRILFAGGRRTTALAHYDLCRRTLAEELGVDPDEETEKLYLRLLAGESPTPRSVGHSPYKGLSPFGPGDTDVFFGRNTVTQKLHAAVAGSGIAVLVGASGSGKSSVINAGLVPTLLGQRSDGYAPPTDAGPQSNWQVLFMRPGPDPVPALDEALAGQQIATATRTDLPHTLLIIDQFEELFTVCKDDTLRTRFLDRLLAPVDRSAAQATRLLLAMRADFMSEALHYAALADLLQNHAILLGPLGRAELQQVIEEPARLRGVAFEPGLVERLLVDIGDGPGQLPLLQFALTQLWDRQSDGWATHEAFDAIGGVRGALAGYAEEVFAELSAEQQEQARHIFLTLVQPALDAQDVRRMATRSEIGEQRWPLVQHLANARLLVTNHNARSGETVELVHEALIREWARLQTWVELDREFQTWRQRTRAALAAWQESPTDETALLNGLRLLEAERWLGERNDEISALTREYITVSVAARERRNLAEAAVRQRELANAQTAARAEHQRAESEARGRRQLLWLTTVLIVVTVIAVFAAIFAFRAQQAADAQRANAEHIARTALARQLGAQAINLQDTQADLALLLIQESVRLNANARDNAELLLNTKVDPRLNKIMYGVNGAIYGMRLQADEKSVLAHNEFGSVLLWDLATGQQRALLASTVDEPQGAVFSPQGEKIATWRDGVITVRNAETVAPLLEISAPAGAGLYTLAFSADGSRLVTYWEDGKVRLWDAETGALLEEYAMTIGELDVLGVTSPDGHVIVLAGEQENKPLIQLWDIATNTAVATLPQNHTDEVHQVSISPDGSLLATASFDGSVRLWDTTTGEQRGEPLLGHTARALSVAFSPDGKTLASGGTDDQVFLWDVASGQQIGAPLLGHSNEVRAAVFSDDGTKLITGDGDGRALVWDISMTHELGGHDDRVRAVLLSPDERTLVTAGFDKQIIVRDAVTFEIQQKVATEHQNAILSASFSPDGKTFATVDAGGLLILWDTATWTPRHVLRSEVQNQLIGLAFSPDSQRVATGAFNGIVEVHDVTTGALVVAPFVAHGNGWAMSLLFSPDGERFYSGSSDQTIRMWDANTFTAIREPMQGHTNRVNDLTLSPDGKTLVSASSDETIRAWDAITGEPIGQPLVGHGKPVWSASFRTAFDRLVLISSGGDGSIIWWDWENGVPLAPPLRNEQESEWMRVSADGMRLLVSFMNSVVRVIDVDPLPWSERPCAIANRNLTEEEWDQFLTDIPYHSTCPQAVD